MGQFSLVFALPFCFKSQGILQNNSIQLLTYVEVDMECY